MKYKIPPEQFDYVRSIALIADRNKKVKILGIVDKND